jgi:hypothetical protein
MVVTDIYDVEVEADSLEDAQALALEQDDSKWVKDENACSAYLGDDHTAFIDGAWVNV